MSIQSNANCYLKSSQMLYLLILQEMCPTTFAVITFEIFRDPVITPSGVTYERAIPLEHLRKVGNFDPVTREPLKEHQMVPNLAIKEAVQAYLKEHSWAYKST
uniref:U-box domain-containing protein n=1 Tax=Triticum urartu TaxID=4572 RepID=A0A8R7JVH2_TRIUA